MSGDKGFSAFPDGDNLFKWKGTIYGAKDTVSLKPYIYIFCDSMPSIIGFTISS